MNLAVFAPAIGAFPPLERILWRRARRHVGGRDRAEVLSTAEALRGRGAEISIDLFGTSARDEGEVRRTIEAYMELPDTAWLSVDLSHLGLRWSRTIAVRAARELATCVGPGCRLQVGAEEATLTDDILAVVQELAAEGAPVMATVQANLLRSPADAAALAAAGVPIRLVKGAFSGGGEVVLAPGVAVDLAFHRIARSIHDTGGTVSLATHDRMLRKALLTDCGPLDCELSFGVRDEDIDTLIADGIAVRVYVPWGPNWLSFYLRRLAEMP